MKKTKKLLLLLTLTFAFLSCSSSSDDDIQTVTKDAVLKIIVENQSETLEMYSKFVSVQFQSQKEVKEVLNDIWEDESKTGEIYWFKKTFKPLNFKEEYQSNIKIQSGGFAFSISKLNEEAKPLTIIIKMYADGELFKEEIVNVDQSKKDNFYSFAVVWNK